VPKTLAVETFYSFVYRPVGAGHGSRILEESDAADLVVSGMSVMSSVCVCVWGGGGLVVEEQIVGAR
jgi:hypothetical protein